MSRRGKQGSTCGRCAPAHAWPGAGRCDRGKLTGGLTRRILTHSQKTIKYVKSKEKDLDGVAQEYRSGVTKFIDSVERLHQAENGKMVEALKKQHESFIKTCEDGVKTCEGFMVRLEQCSPSTRGPGDLEKWLEQRRGLQMLLEGVELDEA